MQVVQKLTLDDVVRVLKQTPEQCVFDWKRDLVLRDEESKSELVKDIAAIANATITSPGFVFYGVDPGQQEPIIGMSKRYDDAPLQELLRGKLDPSVEFLYYDICQGPRLVGILHIPPSIRRPHIVAQDLGKLRKGQILIRKGSSTSGISWVQLYEIYYGPGSPYLAVALQKAGLDVAQQQATVAFLRELRKDEDRAIRDIENLVGLPPGTLGYDRS